MLGISTERSEGDLPAIPTWVLVWMLWSIVLMPAIKRAILPALRFIGILLGMAYVLADYLLLPPQNILMLVATACLYLSPNPMLKQWGKAQWSALNVATCSLIFGTEKRYLSSVVWELKDEYKSCAWAVRFIDFMSEEGHCEQSHLQHVASCKAIAEIHNGLPNTD